MNFIKHSNLANLHAFLGASKFYWLGYDENRLVESYINAKAAEKGTEIHAFAAQCIKLGQKLPKSKITLNMYVNDAIGYRMTPEQTLYYSDNCFGTTDTISYDNDFLRIHDLKTGETPAHMEQLMIYTALFCLEYKIKPSSMSGVELRIYQLDDIVKSNPEASDIMTVCDKIIAADKVINKLRLED